MRANIFQDSVRTNAPQHRLSWVLFYFPGVSHCPAQGPMTPVRTVPAGASGRSAMIVDAATGRALSYAGTASYNCGGPPAPSARQANQFVSVPWTDLGGTRVRASVPGCVKLGYGTPATGTGSAGGPTRWMIEVVGSRPIGPCHAPATTVLVPLSFARPWNHGPAGVVQTGSLGI